MDDFTDRPGTDAVEQAMTVVHRRDFLPAGQARFAGADMPLRIGHGATCSQPSTVAFMLRLLHPTPGHRVLDVGSGSGWTTALLARLVAPGGSVVGVEIEPALVTTGRANLLAAGVHGARIEQAEPGRLGRPEDSPYDRILVSAEVRRLPQSLVDQLADGGRMALPVRGRMVVVERDGAHVRARAAPGTFQFVPLRGGGRHAASS